MVKSIVAFIFVFLPAIGFATDRYVGSGGCGGETPCYTTINGAIAAASAGDTIYIRTGTYNETVSLTTNGSQGSPITLTNYTGEAVTINGGSGIAIGNSEATYYWVIGAQSTRSNFTVTGTNATGVIQFQNWRSCFTTWDCVDYDTDSVHHITIQNMTINGGVLNYANNMIYDNVEFNGQSMTFQYAIRLSFGVAHDNIIRNSEVHHYATRGIWNQTTSPPGTMTSYAVLVEKNTIYDIGNGGSPNDTMGIDFDGAYREYGVQTGIARENELYNIHYHCAIELENCYNCIVERNLIRDSDSEGVQMISYNDNGAYDVEHRDDNMYGLIQHNVIYDLTPLNSSGAKGAIHLYNTRYAKIYNNTIYNIQINDSSIAASGIWIDQQSGSDGYPCQNIEIVNNIISEWAGYAIVRLGRETNLTFNNNRYYDSSQTSTHRHQEVDIGSYTLSSYQSIFSLEQNSTFDNPDFTSAGTGDFTLSQNSPCINTGANLGVDYRYGLNPISVWPSAVSTLDQDSYGVWEIGAYVYGSGDSPHPVQNVIIQGAIVK